MSPIERPNDVLEAIQYRAATGASKYAAVPDAAIVSRAGSNGLPAEWFDEALVIEDMASSEIGRKVLDGAQSNAFRLEFLGIFYQQYYAAVPDPNVMGMAFSKKAKVYLPAVASNAEAATTAIHEGVHMLGVRGSRRAEALARIAEAMHRGGSVDRSAMRRVLGEMNASGAYDNLLWKSGRSTPNFPGLNF